MLFEGKARQLIVRLRLEVAARDAPARLLADPARPSRAGRAAACPLGLGLCRRHRAARAAGLATAFVLVASNGIIAAIRKYVPKQVRIATYIARRYGVMSIPTMIVFKDGQEAARIVGAKGKAQLLDDFAPFI